MTESGSKSTNFGLPNWRNENEYPDESAALELWRWQFIRRRDDYRKDWHNHKLETYNYFKRLHKNKKVLTPDHDEFMCRIPDSIEKYGLRRCPNPALDRPKRLQSPAPDKMDFFDGWLGNQHTHLDNK
ncbi:hypothetical protein [Magnetospirillum sp. 64-120]|uniref:hypothetical protein n=1 Tax=Magnetospirillum sp. 64-120 TaxID=1895778 RepID=UPI0025B9841A|nr:hypothetical protein [Magnetospirillum sp. 64-120]